MTYNFDPDRWLESHRAALEERRLRGDIDKDRFEIEMADLDRRYEEMLERLDGTYQIPQRSGEVDR